MITRTTVLCLCVLALAAPVALAQSSPSQNGYGETQVLPQAPTTAPAVPPTTAAAAPAKTNAAVPAAQVAGAHAAGAQVANAVTPRPVAVNTKGSLPFTGLDIGAVVLAALALLAVGVGLRRATNARSTP
jgi:hypothetical protein